MAEEELRQKLKIEEGGEKEQGRKGGRLEALGKSRMARVKKFVLVVDSLFEVPKSKLGSLDRDIIAWFRENYGILEPNEDKYGKKIQFRNASRVGGDTRKGTALLRYHYQHG